MASIRKTPAGTYKVTYWAQGTQHSKNFRRSIDAERHKRAVETAKDEGTWINPQHGKTTLNDWLNDWHTSRLNLKQNTALRDEGYIRTLIAPHLGNQPLNRLTPQHIRNWIATINQTHKPGTTRKAHQLLKAALNAAIEDRLIATNPAQNTKLPPPSEPQHRYLTIQQTHQLADTIDPRYKTYMYGSS